MVTRNIVLISYDSTCHMFRKCALLNTILKASQNAVQSEPCGTPPFNTFSSDMTLFMQTRCDRLRRYDLNQSLDAVSTPCSCCNRVITMD